MGKLLDGFIAVHAEVFSDLHFDPQNLLEQLVILWFVLILNCLRKLFDKLLKLVVLIFIISCVENLVAIANKLIQLTLKFF